MGIQKYSQSSDWVESFLTTLSQNYKRDIEQEAEINVKTLPKVVWNDNTFYVSLDTNENSADVLNEYGNVVTTIKNASSVGDVEQQLNKEIVSSIVTNKFDKKANTEDANVKQVANLDDELDKVAKYLNITKEADNYAFQPDSSTQNTQTPQNQDMGYQTTDPSINGAENTVTNTPTDSSSGIADSQMNEATTASKEAINDIHALKKELKESKSKIAALEKQLSKVADMVAVLTDEIHAYTNPGNVYDLQSEDQEVAHFNDTANQSAAVIQFENNSDLTTPYGRVSLKDRILQDLDNIFDAPDIIIDEPVVETVEVIPVEPAEPVEIVPTDEIDEGIDEELPELPEEDTIVEVELPVDDTELNEEQDTIENTTDDNIEDKSTIIKLNKKDSAMFKKQICPKCGKHKLSLSTKTASVQDVLCQSCKTKFEVDLNTEEIFRHVGGNK